MKKQIIKRLLFFIPMLLLITIICFSLMELAPYDAIDAMTTPQMPYKQVLAIKEKYGYDKPPAVRYFKWLGGIVQGDFGYSIFTHRSIQDDLFVRIKNTAMLVAPAYITALLLAVLLGMYAALKKEKWQDRIIDGLCSLGMATPSFWVGLLLIYVFSFWLGIFPTMGMYTVGGKHSVVDLLWHYMLPFCTLTFAFLPDLTRYVRSATIKELSQPYVRTAKAMGLSTFIILKNHVLKNISFPLITKIGLTLPMLITGAVITESVFGWPGVGPYFVTAIQNFDYPVIMAVLLLSGAATILGNLLADVLYITMDPRVGFEVMHEK